MGWTVSVSWNAQNDATDIDVSSPLPAQELPSSSEERKLVPLDEWRRRVAVEAPPEPQQKQLSADE